MLHQKLSNKKMHSLKLGLMVVAVCVLLNVRPTETGKSRTKSGILAATQVNGGKSPKNKELTNQHRKTITIDGNNYTLTPAQLLKQSLMEHYDSSLMPLIDYNRRINIDIIFTYRQILDLDEKNQVLKSLIWQRMSWIDESLKWNPADFNGITKIEMPYSLIWRPDIVVYQEIGVKDYSPRLQKAIVEYDGTVKFSEPVAIETTCSIDTAFFPFDVQVCYITFVSWTEPVTRVDLTSERYGKKLFEFTKKYFVNTGEWQLVGMAVRKLVKDYADSLLEEHDMKEQNEFGFNKNSTNQEESKSNQSAANLIHDDRPRHETMFIIPTYASTNYSTLGNKTVKTTMFSEIEFIVVVRRNSSLYMQSMLFPSILLTAVAILGFYLPPDSGERIGLQITILLTFMVFLLAVGEMFPASTGPYLGIYFVLCMGLLGVNLTMTTLVLHLHFKPVITTDYKMEQKLKKYYLIKAKDSGRSKSGCCSSICYENPSDFLTRKSKQKRAGSVVPSGLRHILQLCNRYWSLKEYNAKWLNEITDDETDDQYHHDIFTVDDVSSADNESVFSLCIENSDNKSSSSNSLKVKNDSVEINYVMSPDHSQMKITNHHLDVPHQRKFKRYNSRSFSDSHIPDLSNENMQPPAEERKRSSSKQINEEGNYLSYNTIHHTSPFLHNKNGNIWEKITKTHVQRPVNQVNAAESSSGNLEEQNHGYEKAKPPKNSGIEGKNENHNRFRVLGAINEIKNYMKKNERRNKKLLQSVKVKKEEKIRNLKEQEQERQDMEQEEWKSVARAIDIICFRVYMLLIIVTHTTLFGVALNTWFTDHNYELMQRIGN